MITKEILMTPTLSAPTSRQLALAWKTEWDIYRPLTTQLAWLYYLPQIHVSIQPVADDVGTGASRTAAHNNDDYRLHRDDLEGQRQGERCERHDAKLAEKANEDAPGPSDVTPQLHGVHSAAHGEHDHSEHDGERGAHRQAQDLVEVIRRNEAVRARTHRRQRVTLDGRCKRCHGYRVRLGLRFRCSAVREGEGVSQKTLRARRSLCCSGWEGRNQKLTNTCRFIGAGFRSPKIKKSIILKCHSSSDHSCNFYCSLAY